MKRFYKIGMLSLILIILFCIAPKNTYAATINSGITLDGSFSDWAGKPDVIDIKNDIKSPQNDFIDVKYITDDEYLYLYAERLAASKNNPWHFEVIIPNGITGQNEEVNLFNNGKASFLPVFDVTVSFQKNLNLVTIGYSGQTLETTLSSSANGKAIEFRIPLSKVGLSGPNHEIQFALKSDPDKNNNIDYLPDAYPITLTTGPTGGIYTSVIFFVGVAVMIIKFNKKQKKSNM